MEIVENSDRRIKITHNLGAGEIFGHLLAFLVGLLFVALGSAAIFVEAADIIAPNWAEIQGWSGDRWHYGTGEATFEWEAEDGAPVPHFWSLMLSVLLVAIGLIVFFFGATVLVSARQHLVFDLDAGQVVLSRWGLFQLPSQSFALSDVSADIEIGTDEGGETYQSLSVAIVRVGGQLESNGWPTQSKTLFEARCTPDQALALDRLLQAVPGSTRSQPLPPMAASAS